MEFRLAKLRDATDLYLLEKEVFTSPWTLEQFERELKDNEFAKTYVIYEGETLVGYINYWIIFDQATINKVCIRESYRKQGLAQKLIDSCLLDLKENECMVVTLEVRVSNDNAIKLYEKNGFETVLRKECYYSDGEDAFYMVKGVN